MPLDAYADDTDDEPQTDQLVPSDKLKQIAAHDGNLVEMLEEKELTRIGGEAIREFGYDKTGRMDWEDSARKALKLATQKSEKKNTPFANASNVNYPILSVAAIQFAARAYPAIIKGDEVLMNKVVGFDPLGFKQQRAQRLATFTNDQLIYEIEEWEPGTRTLLHALPIVGAGFRKGGWDHVLDRPRLDYADALNVYAPIDSPTLDQAPRVTETFQRYPYQIAQRLRSKEWAQFDYEKDSDDTQKPCDFIEQHRYMDLDGDGLPEPYIVTVEVKNEKVVRIDPAFDPNDIRVGETGEIEAVTRVMPWIDYTFLPDLNGGLYGMGFGKLIESIQDAIDTSLNQMFDAGHLANAPGGFLAQGLNIRAGTYRIEPNVYRTVNAQGKSIAEAIYTHQFPGPSETLFKLVDMLLAAAKDITAVKDVLTGEAPAGQPAASTLALIEQGLSVFTAIYKSIYRSLRKEYRLLYKLNARYLSDEKYKGVLDAPLQPPPQQTMQKMQQNPPPPELQPALDAYMQAEQARGVTRADFSDKDYDIRPIADPSAVTQAQQLAKARLIGERAQARPDLYNGKEAEKRILQAARVDDADTLLTPTPNPLAARGAVADVAVKENKAGLDKAKTDQIEVETKGEAFDQGAKQGELGSLADQPDHAPIPANPGLPGGSQEVPMDPAAMGGGEPGSADPMGAESAVSGAPAGG